MESSLLKHIAKVVNGISLSPSVLGRARTAYHDMNREHTLGRSRGEKTVVEQKSIVAKHQWEHDFEKSGLKQERGHMAPINALLSIINRGMLS
ncbi:hypothetical protein AAC387_Pa04g1269 [Persea americana]